MSERMPTLFIGHGSPENAVADNAYTRHLSALAAGIPRPHAVLVVSAHYTTMGPAVTSASQPRTIHDFYGFPDELYKIAYPAPGAPGLADDIPTVELSLDLDMPAADHYELGRRLAELPDHGVLVLGSGNIVHNLGAIDWHRPHGGYEWCAAFDAAVQERLALRDDEALLDYRALPGGPQSVPTPDHYLPLLYAAAAAGADARALTTYEALEMGSLSMRCVRFG